MEFKLFRDIFQQNFNQLAGSGVQLLTVDLDKDALWNVYLDSFPEGANPIYRKRREYDCSCCRHFIKEIGGTVYIDDHLNLHTIFEFGTGSEVFQPVMDAMDAFVKRHIISGIYLSETRNVGTDRSVEVDNCGVHAVWEHFYMTLPNHLVFNGRSTIDTVKGRFRDTRNVFKRSLDEISLEAINTVLELIRSNTLYKGEEWMKSISELRSHKLVYDQLTADKRELYCWMMASSVGDVLGRIRNHSIGVLLTDISNGMELDDAVKRYEKIVAPANYKRPKAIFTKKMLEEAQKTITDLGYMDALPRRFATLDDITVNNILFSNRDAAKRIGGSVFDQMMAETKSSPKQFSRVEEVAVEKFLNDVLPNTTEMEVYMENRHEANMVSLIAPQIPDAKTMFKWNNGFSWAYAGNLTDSNIRENVKNAGGRVDGVLRFSIQWNDVDYDGNDLDAHCVESFRNEVIFYGHKMSRYSHGNLDVDIVHPISGRPAVENITFPTKSALHSGQYRFFVHCYSNRGGKNGFRAEIEFDGKLYRYDYCKPLRSNEIVEVAIVTLDEHGSFSIDEKLSSQFDSRDIWGVKTNTFIPVSVAMYSPNYWDGQQGVGHRHYFFMLKGCVNPESPNGFYNEFLRQELVEHKRVFEALGGKMAASDTDDQLSGLGFSSTKRNDMVVKIKGATERILKVKF